MKIILLFLLLILSVTNAASNQRRTPTVAPILSSTVQPPTETRSRFAMLDDVRLLANGLLQLGQSLREFVHKTKAQINDIFQKLNIFDRSFYQLSVVTSEIKEEEEKLKKTTVYLKENNEEIRNLSMEINSKINNILQERSQLHSKVGGLEEKLQGLSQSIMPLEQIQEISGLKEVIETQEKTITDLLKSVKEQHEQLNYQNGKIKSLEDKLSYDNFQDTAEKFMDLSPETPDPFGYLTMNSTNGTIDINDYPVGCSNVFKSGHRKSGIYPIKPNQSEPFNVYCEMSSDGASTVIQRREDGSVDFDQSWGKYEHGFGKLEKHKKYILKNVGNQTTALTVDLHWYCVDTKEVNVSRRCSVTNILQISYNEFWLGLQKIYSIAQHGEYILHIELEDWKEEKRFIEYTFTLGGPATDYTLHLAPLSGDLPDAMSNHTGMKFSTKDRDNDKHDESNCARNYTGGWWFDACGDTNLNGRYAWIRPKARPQRRKGIYWRPAKGSPFTLKSTKITIRPST